MLESYKPKLVRYVRLNKEFDSNNGLEQLLENLKGATKQKEVVLSYFQLSATEKKPITVKKLTETAQTTSTIIKALIDKNIFEEYYLQEDRVNFKGVSNEGHLKLSAPQDLAFNSIKESLSKKKFVCFMGLPQVVKQKFTSSSLKSILPKENKFFIYYLKLH